MILGFPRLPLHRRNHSKGMEIHLFSMILGFPRFPLHRKKHERKMEVFAFPMILGFPRFPLHRRNYEKCGEINAFSMILGLPRFPLHKGICWLCFKHLGCFFLGRLSRWLTRANVAIPSRDSAKKFAKKLRNDPLRESHFLNACFLNSGGGGGCNVKGPRWCHFIYEWIVLFIYSVCFLIVD